MAANMEEKPIMDPRLGWRALVTVNLVVYVDMSVEKLLMSLFTSPDYVNASKAILIVCGMGPLEFDGRIDEAFRNAIRALALAAGVSLGTGVLPEITDEVSRLDVGGSIERARRRDTVGGWGSMEFGC